MRTIKVAMIQLNNAFQDQASGYEKAKSLITEAAAQGIDLAVLPELSGCGYIPNQSIWKHAEGADGKTVQWACALSSHLKIYIGAGFVETDGSNFYNSYFISGPDGSVCGMIRKEDAESYCFWRGRGSTYVDTGLGRIGIGICADNHYLERLHRMRHSNIDFMLMPHASPAPYKSNRRVSEKDMALFEEQPHLVASVYSKYIRTPTIYVNAVGSFPEFSGGCFVKDFNECFRLMGGSLATGSDGAIMVRMGNEEGFATADIIMDKSAGSPLDAVVHPKKAKPVAVFPDASREAVRVYHGKWLHPGNPVFRYVILPMVTLKGTRSYNKAHKRFMNALQEAQDSHAKKTSRIEKK